MSEDIQLSLHIFFTETTAGNGRILPNHICGLTNVSIRSILVQAGGSSGAECPIYSVCGRWVARKSGPIGHWGGDRRRGRRNRTASPNGSATRTTTSPNTLPCWKPAARRLRQSQNPARLLRLGSRGQADDRRVHLPQPTFALAELDLPQACPQHRFLHRARSARTQPRSQRPGGNAVKSRKAA